MANTPSNPTAPNTVSVPDKPANISSTTVRNPGRQTSPNPNATAAQPISPANDQNALVANLASTKAVVDRAKLVFDAALQAWNAGRAFCGVDDGAIASVRSRSSSSAAPSKTVVSGAMPDLNALAKDLNAAITSYRAANAVYITAATAHSNALKAAKAI